MCEYEKMRQRNVRTMKAVMEATKKMVSYPNLYFYNVLINM